MPPVSDGWLFTNVFILFTISIILISSCSIVNDELAICDKKQTIYDKDMCYLSYAGEKKDVKGCDKIENIDFKNSCYEFVGPQTLQISICNKITNDKKSLCIARIAEWKKEIEICNNIQEQSGLDRCYAYVGVAKQDYSICDKSKDQKWIEYCYGKVAIAKKEISNCNKIAGYWRNECYFEIASKDISLCSNLETQEEIDNCKIAVRGYT